MNIRGITPAEKLYLYSNSQEINMKTALVGHLRGDFGSNGKSFYSTWFGFKDKLNTDEFKKTIDYVINTCRSDETFGMLLYDRNKMLDYCKSHPECGINGNYTTEYGVRVDTDQYVFLMRLNPTKGDYNLYCYCYGKMWFDSHLKQAENGIRFIKTNYDELFRIADGDKIRITESDGQYNDRVCRYIDDYHVEIGNSLFHICEFAELCSNNGKTVIPLRSSIPEMCYSVIKSTGDIIILKKGESGYFRTDITSVDLAEAKSIVDEYNGTLGISKAQEAAMVAGSMFGWEVPGADPKHYDSEGKLRIKQSDRGDAR